MRGYAPTQRYSVLPCVLYVRLLWWDARLLANDVTHTALFWLYSVLFWVQCCCFLRRQHRLTAQ
jgi:hypothetical protein